MSTFPSNGPLLDQLYLSIHPLKCICICISDDDGKVELVVGHTDKFVKAYRWEPCCVFSASGSPNTSSSSSCTQCSICGGVSDSSTSSSTATVSLMSANTPKVTESAMRDTCCTCLHPNAPPTSVGDTTTTTTTTAAAAAGTNVDGERGKFVPVYGWRLQFMVCIVNNSSDLIKNNIPLPSDTPTV